MITKAVAKDWLNISIDDDDAIIDLLIEKATERINNFLNTEYTELTAPATVKGCALNLVAYWYDNRDGVAVKNTSGLEAKTYRTEKEILDDIVDLRPQSWVSGE
jgi:hypothetical protein